MSKIDFTARLDALRDANTVGHLSASAFDKLATLLAGGAVGKGELDEARELLAPAVRSHQRRAAQLGFDPKRLTPAQASEVRAYTDAVLDLAAGLRLRAMELDPPRKKATELGHAALVAGGASKWAVHALELHVFAGGAVMGIEGLLAVMRLTRSGKRDV
jgi:hypothetical protein